MLGAIIRMQLQDDLEAAMKRVSFVLLLVAVAAIGAGAQQQSLADAAKQAQADKKAAPVKHVYTNDDIAPSEPAANPAAETAAAKPADTAKADAGKADKDKADKKDTKDTKDAKETKADADKAADVWKQKIGDQQKAIADQERELNLMQREHQIKIAEFYADAGTQLRNQGQWLADEKKYQDDLQTKKQALDDAKAKLADLQEQARKAGVPAS